MALTLSHTASGEAGTVALPTAADGASKPRTLGSWSLLGHEADVLGAASSTDHDGVFATCDADGRMLVWQYNPAAAESPSTPSAPLPLPALGTRCPCANVCAMQSGGPAVLDLCFLAGRPLLAAAQGNNEVTIWDVRRGERVDTIHRRRGGSGLEGGSSSGNPNRQPQSGPPPYLSMNVASWLSSASSNSSRRRTRSGHPANASSEPSRAAAPFPVLNAVVALPNRDGDIVCYGGDDGLVVVYDLRSGRVETSLKLGLPVTSLCSAAGSRTSNSSRARADQIFAGDACGSVRWLDLRSGGTAPLAEMWLGKGPVTDILVDPRPPRRVGASATSTDATNLAVHHPAAVGVLSGRRPEAVWLDTTPFAPSDEGRVRSRLSLLGAGQHRASPTDEEAGEARLSVWRGSWVGDQLAFPLADADSAASGVQLVRPESFAAGPWRRVRATATATATATITAARKDSGALMPHQVAHLVRASSSPPIVSLAACGAEVMLHEVA